MDKITLDREVFKALASDTRLEILKALDVRQKTVTELAKELELNKATVFEHLEKLEAVGLIQKLDNEDRKWVYWQLTWTGRRLLHPEKITLAILLSTSGAALLAGIAALWLWATRLVTPGGEETPTTEADAPPSIAAEMTRAAPVEPPAPEHDPLWMGLAIAFALLALALTLAALWVHRRAKAKRAGAMPAP